MPHMTPKTQNLPTTTTTITQPLNHNQNLHHIKGNASERIKSLSQHFFSYFISAKGKSYGAETGEKLRLVEINVYGLPQHQDVRDYDSNADDDESAMCVVIPEDGTPSDGGSGGIDQLGNEVRVETVFEVVVDQDMCNIHGTLHGACAAYVIDPCSSSSLVTLGLILGIDGTGVSQSMNLIWHRPIHMGTKIRIKSTSMYITGKLRTARCEIWGEDRLCVSAIHSTINPSADSQLNTNALKMKTKSTKTKL